LIYKIKLAFYFYSKNDQAAKTTLNMIKNNLRLKNKVHRKISEKIKAINFEIFLEKSISIFVRPSQSWL